MARLLQAVGKLIGDPEAGQLLTKILAFENSNKTCQAVLYPYRMNETINDFIRLCANIGPAYAQGAALAAAFIQVERGKVRKGLFCMRKTWPLH